MILFVIIFSIITLLGFIQNNKGKDSSLYQLTAGICFAVSWVILALWFVILIEGWQIGINTSGINESLLLWERTMQNILQNIAFLFPFGRLELAILYALPLAIFPLGLIICKKDQATSILFYSAVLNLLFLWSQLLVENWARFSSIQIPLQGIITLATYVLVITLLVRKRPFISVSV